MRKTVTQRDCNLKLTRLPGQSSPIPKSSGAQNMLAQSLRNAGYALVPRFFVDKYIHHKMLREARELSGLRGLGADPVPLMEGLWRSYFFRPLQKKSEIQRLLQMLSSLQPAVVCEIGAAGCGTTFLLLQAAAQNATVITLDLNYTATRQAALENFALSEQRISCLREDSHRPETARSVEGCLEGRRLDLLFLDGDHSYEGVKADFDLYSPLVGPGGVVVFHDIVPDFRSRYGFQTASDSGGVPQFWQEIKSSYADVEEIVEDYEQDGFGIGVLHCSEGAQHNV